MHKLNAKAVIAGLCTDIFSTKLFLLATTIMLLDPGSSSTAPIQRIDPDLLTWFCLAWGLVFTGLGGFVAGRLAKQHELMHGLGVAWFSIMTSCYTGGWTVEAVGPLLWSIGLIGTVVAALAGSYAARLFQQK